LSCLFLGAYVCTEGQRRQEIKEVYAHIDEHEGIAFVWVVWMWIVWILLDFLFMQEEKTFVETDRLSLSMQSTAWNN
jgi:hypothetical protein